MFLLPFHTVLLLWWVLGGLGGSNRVYLTLRIWRVGGHGSDCSGASGKAIWRKRQGIMEASTAGWGGNKILPEPFGC